MDATTLYWLLLAVLVADPLPPGDGCPAQPTVRDEPDTMDDGSHGAARQRMAPGQDGAEVVLFEIEGGGHTWPGQDAVVSVLGKTTFDISANDLMWEFFQKHPLK